MIGIEHPIDGRARFRLGPFTPRVHNVVASVILGVVTIFVVFISLSNGTTQMTMSTVWQVLLGNGAEDAEFAVWQVRVPRILAGLLSGFAIAVAGAVLQTLARNPLSDPGLLGLSQGAVLAVLVLIVWFPGLDAVWRGMGATLGALAVGCLILVLVGPTRAAGLSIVLMGIAVETTLSALSTMIVVHSPPELSFQLAAWMIGALDRVTWGVLWGYLPWACLLVPLVAFAGPSMRAYALGDDLARSVGEPIGVRRAAILLVTVAIAGATTAVVGPLLFLGIMAPHLARFLSPASGAALLWLSGMMGALLVVAADTVSRLLGPIVPLPLGLCLVLPGVPFFVATLRLAGSRRT